MICPERQAAVVDLIVRHAGGHDAVQTEALDETITPFVNMFVEREEPWSLDVSWVLLGVVHEGALWLW